jgi:Ser-tRNA(Ala) deacylase AlaX
MENPTEKTTALYQTDGTLTTHTSTLSTLTPLSSLPASTTALFKPPPPSPETSAPYILTTPSTIFHAQGGGQPSDTGTIATTPASASSPVFHVHQARTLAASILHMGVFSPAPSSSSSSDPDPDTPSSFTPGAQIAQSIDVPKRLLHSRLHTAGHIIGCAAASLVASGALPADITDGKASHYPGAAFCEFNGLIPSSAKGAIQDAVDALVARDLAVEVALWTEERARKECTGVLESFKQGEEGVRVVRFGDAGAYPCGGTHVQRLGEVGRVVIRNIKRQKGVTKVSYEVVDGGS